MASKELGHTDFQATASATAPSVRPASAASARRRPAIADNDYFLFYSSSKCISECCLLRTCPAINVPGPSPFICHKVRFAGTPRNLNYSSAFRPPPTLPIADSESSCTKIARKDISMEKCPAVQVTNDQESHDRICIFVRVKSKSLVDYS